MAERRQGPLDPRLVRLLPDLRSGMAVLGVASALGTAATIVQAVALARLVTAVFVHHAGPSRVGGDLLAVAVSMGLKSLTAAVAEWAAQRTSRRARVALRRRLVDAVGRLGPAWLAGADRGALSSTAGAGIETLDGYLTRALPALIAAGVTPPLVLVAIGVADWESLLILAVTLPLVPLFLVLVGVTTKRHMDRQWATLAALSGQFLDLLQGLTTLKVYGRSRAQVDAVRAGTERYRRHTLATLRVAFLSGLVLDLLATLSVALVAVTIGLRLDHGHVGLEAAMVVLLLAPEVFAPLRAVGTQHHATEEARAVVDATMAVLDAADALDRAAPVPMATPAGVLRALHGVSVTYPGRDLPALYGADLDLTGPGLVAVVGPSGAGKSTLLGVLLGQVAPTSGRAAGAVIPDDVAWVPQRPRLTQETVAAEVRLGDPTLNDRALGEVLDLCATPPAATALGEDGSSISAGQRRRVAVARAIARARRATAGGRTPLVLLDEPTEDLDAATDAVLARVIDTLALTACVVTATHDRRLEKRAGRVLRMIDGCIASDTLQMRAVNGRDFCPVTALAGALAPDPAPAPGGHPGEAGKVSAAATGTTATGWRHARLRSALKDAPGARKWLGLACLFGGLGGVSGLALTATSVWLICRAAQHPNVQALGIAVVGVRTFALARAGLRYLERLAAHDGALRLLAEIRGRVFAALEPLAPAGLGQMRRGDLLRRFTSDVDGAQEALVRAIVPLAGAATTALAATVVVAAIAPAAGAVLAAGLLVGGAAVPWLAARATPDGTAAAAAAGRRDTLVNGLLDGLDELAAYGAVPGRVDAIAAADLDAQRDAARAGRVGALAVGAGGLTAAATVTAVVAASVAAITAGRTAGLLLGVAAVTALVAFDAIATLPSAYAAMGRCVAGLRRVEAVLASAVPMPEPRRSTGSPTPVRLVTADSITLRPAAGCAPVLTGATLDMAAGERVAVVGPSGSGKSTLLAAVLRLLPTEVHPVTLTGTDGVAVAVANLQAAQLPPLVAGSLQGDHVFATSLRDNLRLVAPTASDAELDAVAARVGLLGWVRDLPEGWSTPAGADGADLSGGQRQRLLLARALLAAPEVLVLDEPTAHLDAATEAAVMADLLRSTAGRTVLLSTHRAGVLAGVDWVLTVDGGRLVGHSPDLSVAG